MNLEILAERTKVLGPNHPATMAVRLALVSALTLVSTQEANIYKLQESN
jgi:hypothetical protein